jgi:hypothetical protein
LVGWLKAHVDRLDFTELQPEFVAGKSASVTENVNLCFVDV